MNIHDARARYTRAVIREQFLRLLREKPVAKITVKELCGACGINRATFYRHYMDLYDLMEQMEQSFLEELAVFLRPGQHWNTQTLYTQLLTMLQSYGEDWLILGGENGDPQFYGAMLRRCWELGYPRLAQQRNLLEPERRMLYCYITQGTGGVLHDWIRNGMREPVEQVAAFLSKTTESLVLELSAPRTPEETKP